MRFGGAATVVTVRRVLLVIRTATALNRLLDIVPVLADDTRIELSFTVAAGSAFEDGLPALLDTLDARSIPWDEAVRRPFHLALTASANGDLYALPTPVLLVPHGAGFNKLQPEYAAAQSAPSGLTPEQLLHNGRVVPAGIGLAHPEQVRRLGHHCPPAAEYATVVGDPCHDRLRASLPWREDYRSALAVGPAQSLVLLSSTWGPESLIGRHPQLAARLLAELPVDEYRTALVMHPNVWTYHGEFQLRLWLRSALAAGLILIPPDEGWRAALVAADTLVCDHGSVALYGAAVGLPLLLATDGGPEVAEDSPMNELRRGAPRLDLRHPLRPQFDHVPPPVPLPAGAFSHEDQSLALLTELIYGHLGLPAPTERPLPQPVPLPAICAEPVREFTVRTELVEPEAEGKPAVIRVRRFPARLLDLSPHSPAPTDAPVQQHRLCEPTPQAHHLAQSATVLARRAGTGAGHGPVDETWPERTLARFPQCRIAAVVLDRTRCLLQLRDGGRPFHTELRSEAGGGPGPDPLLAVSALQHALSATHPEPPRSLRLEIGGHRYTATFTPATGA
ncbi:translation initiation factor 2 [Kitasatospora sp. GP82]|uniref:translation initiation factor 2 n=1 Tax=Kitasatospora sp. GP82 TaxID=3035089 RepID=UPI0024759D6D|nr:translation initiation factor 2 [Kitasatospora sp. GP82]MDH6128909.1 hypothetical protein [Kitasatospora sp. GP82]